MSDLIEKLSDLRSQFNCFDENERDAYNTLSEAIKVVSERPEPREDDKHCSNCIYSGRPIYKSPCSECRDKSQWEMKQPEPHEDAVSRQDALDVLDGFQIAHEQGEYSAYERYRQEMCALSSVTPKRKTGKWITESLADDFAFVYSLKCSECGKYYGWEHNFCPNCGADMNPLPESYKPKEKNDACD